jgi:UDP-GlcNAc:undecaprenyl-phosphate GlcNAc-1-phosphate transferase
VVISQAEKRAWRRHPVLEGEAAFANIMTGHTRQLLVVAPRKFLAIGIPVYLISAGLLIDHIPRDFAAMSALISVLVALEVTFGHDSRSIMRRALIYITAVFIVFLGINYPSEMADITDPIAGVFFVLIALSFTVAVKFSPRRRKVEFRTTAMDYLILAVLLGGFIASKGQAFGDSVMLFAIEIIVLFYASELLITENRDRWDTLTIASLATALILGFRGFL